MNMRDKNGETASERIARKFFSGDLYGITDCHTTAEVDGRGKVYLVLYGTRIAYAVSGAVYILNDFSKSGTALTKSRQRALEREAMRRGLAVRYA